MTTRVNALLVTLDKDMREDDAQALVDAIMLLRGVIDVRTEVANPADIIALMRARKELRDKIVAIVYPPGED